MRVVVDTTVWFEPAALEALGERIDHDVVVPAIVFTERARQLERDGRRSPQEFLREIRSVGWRIEPYGARQALPFAVRLVDDRDWRRLARDAMIAGHVGEAEVLWTANVKDFEAVGLPRRRIMDILTFRTPSPSR
jgi:predicted nucleic acid-binding protein